MRNARIAMLLLSWIAMGNLVAARDRDLAEEIDAIFRSAGLGANDAPGAAVLVIKDGRAVFRRGYGVADLRTRSPIDARTDFRLASVTKQFTAMSVMLLVHDGKLRYDECLTDVFPDFPPYGKAITIRNLLNHTSGLLDYEDLMQPAGPTDPALIQIKDAGVLELLGQQKTIKFTPGSSWAYSNSGYAVLAMIVEKVSGQPFGDFLHDRIFAPLKMDQTVAYQRGKSEVTHRAFGYTTEKGVWQETDQSSTSAVLGDGGIYSSLDDLAKWDRALRLHTVLSEDEMRPALTPVKVADGDVQEPSGTPAAYGFGWFLNPYKGHRRMWHYGETVGFRTTIQRFPDDGLTIIVLANRADLVPQELALRVADLYLGGH